MLKASCMNNLTPDYPRNSPKSYQAKERAYLARLAAGQRALPFVGPNFLILYLSLSETRKAQVVLKGEFLRIFLIHNMLFYH